MRNRKRKSLVPGDQRGSARRIALWKKALFATVTSLAFFLALELLLWLLGAERTIDREDPTRGFSGLVSTFVREGETWRTRRAVRFETFNDQSFAAAKPPGGVRLFCLGGSSAYGFPWGGQVAFTAIVGDVLQAAHPGLVIEAVNASGISYAMHRLGIVAREVIEHAPDVLIVYSGHNEFVEPSFLGELKRRGRLRNSLEYPLLHSRLYSALRSLWVRSIDEEQSAGRRFGTRVRRETVVYGDAGKRRVVEEYEKGLRAIVRLARERAVRVVLATVPCNLRGWRPQGSTLGAALDESAQQKWIAAYRAGQRKLARGAVEEALTDFLLAADLAPAHAETHYLLGQVHERLERWDEARAAYRLACDHDASPIRRISAINDAVRAVAADEDVLLVDVDRIFEAISHHGLVGFDLIEDYVHPTLEGHEIIAWHIWRAMEDAGWFGAGRAATRELFDRVVAERPSVSPDENWLYNQGCVLGHQGRTDQAIEKFRQVLEISPHPGALGNLALLLEEKGDLEEATRLFRGLVELDPGYAEAHDHLGRVLARQGKLEEATRRHRRALEVRPGFAEAHNNLGKALRSQGQLDEAIRHYRRALAARPGFAEAHNNLGNALSERGATRDALAHYRRALELQPVYPEAHNNLGAALRSLGEVDLAIGHYRRAIEDHPVYTDALVNLGNALAEQGQLAEAIERYREALRVEPASAGTHNNLASTLDEAGRLDEALEHFRTALRLRPGLVTAEIGVARILATHPDSGVRDAQLAIELALRAVASTGERSRLALDALAAAYAAAGRYDRAIEAAKKALALPSPSSELTSELRHRLELYESSRPYRRDSGPRE